MLTTRPDASVQLRNSQPLAGMARIVTSFVLVTERTVEPVIFTLPCFVSADFTVTVLASVMLSLRITEKVSWVPSLKVSTALTFPQIAVSGMSMSGAPVVSLSARVPSLFKSMPSVTDVPSVNAVSGKVNFSPRMAENTSEEVASVAM